MLLDTLEFPLRVSPSLNPHIHIVTSTHHAPPLSSCGCPVGDLSFAGLVMVTNGLLPLPIPPPPPLKQVGPSGDDFYTAAPPPA